MRDARAFVGGLIPNLRSTKIAPSAPGLLHGWPHGYARGCRRADRIGAACAYHPVSLATEGEDSPHLLIPKINAACLIALAENDDEQHPDDKDVLRQAFADNKLLAEVIVFEGAPHGWCVGFPCL